MDAQWRLTQTGRQIMSRVNKWNKDWEKTLPVTLETPSEKVKAKPKREEPKIEFIPVKQPAKKTPAKKTKKKADENQSKLF